jgi:DNA helicase-2/ATP-dependent DNA helicase PcrA
MEEERRLLYVGITRAKDRLYLLHAQNRSQYGYAEPAEPSRFIEDIPNQLLELSSPGRSTTRWSSSASDNADADPGSAYRADADPGSAYRADADPGSAYRADADPGSVYRGLRDKTYPAGRGAPAERWTSSTTPTPIQTKFKPGAKVIHPTWGDGMVLNSRIQDGDEVLDIFFENVGLKRVIASMAKLEVKS